MVDLVDRKGTLIERSHEIPKVSIPECEQNQAHVQSDLPKDMCILLQRSAENMNLTTT